MHEKNIINMLVMFGGLPESCYSILGQTEPEIQEKINTIWFFSQKVGENM